MELHGLQKMTLLDFPGHVACTVFLGGCDFRCPFCHNFELIDGTEKPLMSDEVFFKFLNKRHGLLDGVAITGGEPCLHKDLPAFLKRIKEMGFLTKLDTNGYHPELLESILSSGLTDYVAMDIKNSEDRYGETCGVTGLDLARIRKSIQLLMDSNVDFEFRTTVVEEFHDVEDFEKIGRMIRGAKRYFLQCFTDRESVPFGNLHAPSKEKLEACARVVKPYVEQVNLRGVE